jgi:SPP1 gp7 family putative phage head morphogenesis protein
MATLTNLQNEIIKLARATNLGSQVKFVSTLLDANFKSNPGMAAYYSQNTNTVIFNSDIFVSRAKYVKFMSYAVSKGAAPPSMLDPLATAAHEFAHSIFITKWQQLKNGDWRVTGLQNKQAEAAIEKYLATMGSDAVAKELGSYALSNIGELAAQARQVWLAGGNASPALRELSDTLSAIAEKGGFATTFTHDGKVLPPGAARPTFTPPKEYTGPALPDVAARAKVKIPAMGRPVSVTTKKTTNQLLYENNIRHQIYTLRYSTQLANETLAILDRSSALIKDMIRSRLADNEGLSSSQEWARLKSLQANIEALRQEDWAKAQEYLDSQLKDLSHQETITIDAATKSIVPVVINTVLPSAQLLESIVTSRPFQGAVLKDWLGGLEAKDIQRIHSAVQAGMVAGQSAPAIARSILGTAAQDGADGILAVTQRDLTTLVRTAVQFTANESRNSWALANSDIISGQRYTATLDGRTSAICRGLDGSMFDVGQGPVPPLHMNCRSTRVNIVTDKIIGMRPFNATSENLLAQDYADQNGYVKVRTRDDLPHGTKGKFDEWARFQSKDLIGSTPAATTYDEFLRNQTQEFQNEVLGPSRAAMFRDGMTLDKFVDYSGHQYTLAELKAKTMALPNVGTLGN